MFGFDTEIRVNREPQMFSERLPVRFRFLLSPLICEVVRWNATRLNLKRKFRFSRAARCRSFEDCDTMVFTLRCMPYVVNARPVRIQVLDSSWIRS